MNIFSQSQQLSQKIGLFGGTFNPLHRGHLGVAKEVLHQFGLDQIHFIPCALPPHKTAEPLAGAIHRLEMVRLAVSDEPDLIASDVEIRRDGPSYTCDTLRAYKEHLLPNARLYFLVGLDAFLEIHTWKRFAHLFNEAAFIVMDRPGAAPDAATFLQIVLAYVQRHISPRYEFSEDDQLIRHPDRQAIRLAAVTPVDIASTQIRQMIQHGEAIAPLVTAKVARYIEAKGLYR